jgi:hypothetical protein
MRTRLLLLIPLVLFATACASTSQPQLVDGCSPICCGWTEWANCPPYEGPPPVPTTWPQPCCPDGVQCPNLRPPDEPDRCKGNMGIDCSSAPPPVPPPTVSCASTETPCNLGDFRQGRLQFAVIGDWGDAVCAEPPSCSSRVASMIQGWNERWPLDFMLSLGDNFYPQGSAQDVATNMALYQWIDPQQSGRFLPAVGNHDLYNNCGQPYYNYFSFLRPFSPNVKPYSPRYYSYVISGGIPGGLIEVFSLNADDSEPDGRGPTCRQGVWLQNALAASTAVWKIVIFHEPPFSSYYPGTKPLMRWPFAEWGASIVLNGHIHAYERIIDPATKLTYVINGLGGVQGLDKINDADCFPPIAGSQVRYTGTVGAMIGTATDDELRFCMMVIDPDHPDGTCVDNFALKK